ncbi:ribosome maturation factor RimP, partial [Candidatus Bipolaricaulota bacterium]|nr:ribosome maturation factor RimP [Candidatus Bipolaricaulota bacterium]
ADLIDRSYELQVSSPGIERPLLEPGHYELAEGETVEVKTFAKVNGEKEFQGKLLGYDLEEDRVRLDCEGEVIDLPVGDIARATTKQTD